MRVHERSSPSVLAEFPLLALLALSACEPAAMPPAPDAGVDGGTSTADAPAIEADAGPPGDDAPIGTDARAPDADRLDAGAPDAGSSVALRIATPWNGAVLGGARPRVHTLPGDVSATVEICRDRACTDVAETLSGVPPLSPASDLTRGRYFVRARASEGPWSTTFAFVVLGSGTSNASWLGYADFDGDGAEDGLLRFTLPADHVATFEGGTGAPVASGWTRTLARSSFTASRAAVVGDVDGDGYTDVVVEDLGLHLYRGGPEGLPAASEDLAIARSDGTPRRCSLGWGPLGDVNRDGYADVALTCDGSSATAPAITWLQGGPDGLDTEALLVGALPFGIDGAYVGGFDAQGDGYGDFFAPDGSYLVGGPFGPTAGPTLTVPCGDATLRYQSFGDHDGDGMLELVEGRSVACAAGLRTDDFDGATFGTSTDLAVANLGITGMDARRDVDGDGRTDVAVVTRRTGTQGVAVMARGSGEINDVGLGVPRATVVEADFDGDGFSDALFSGAMGTADWFPGSAAGLDVSRSARVVAP